MKPKIGQKETVPTLVYALGGLHEIGKNMYVVEHKDEIVMMDCGQKFGNNLPGVNTIIPNFKYLKDNQKRVRALVITHGHEDHIGAVPYILKEMDIPEIYAPRLAMGMIKNKLKEHRINYKNLIEYNGDTVIKTKHFEISFFLENHSIPDCYGVAYKTPNGVVVNTADYKFDFNPIGPKADFAKMSLLGEQGVDLLLSDSTNSEVPGHTASETTVKEEIEALFANSRGRIIISTFSSNINRIGHIIQTAQKFNRKIAIFGRSMTKIVDIGTEYGIIKNDQSIFIKAEAIKAIEPNKLLILTTGSQGEPLAALTRIAAGEHKFVKIIPGDTVTFSSSPIPGNNLPIANLVNDLVRLGAKTRINNENGTLHTSGHASQGEQQLMLSLIRPKYFMPVHGEFRMLKIHGETAQNLGVDKNQIFTCANGDIVELLNGECKLGDRLFAGAKFLDRNGLDVGSKLMNERIKLADEGVIAVIVSINLTKNQLLNYPKIITKGFIFVKDNLTIIREIQSLANRIIVTELKNKEKTTLKNIKKICIEQLSKFVYRRLRQNPMILPVILNKYQA